MTENEATAVPSMNIEKLYVKDISFESPQSPRVFGIEQSPEVGIQLGIGHAGLNVEQGLYEVTLSVTATASNGDATLFLAEVKQAGIFRIGGVPKEQLPLVLEIGCPSVLLPFVREAINELVTRGGFPPLLISPVNFEALFQDKLARAQAQATQQASTTH
jgi:preprotein translocase subunit SecB